MKNLLFILLNSNRISNEDLLKWGAVIGVVIIVIIAFFVVIYAGHTLGRTFFQKNKNNKENKK